ncbi:MAG: riboflavin synthase, partial [Chloroflexi bacterium]|nr:riboflavin synthase [Chloroflexota bacterium]
MFTGIVEEVGVVAKISGNAMTVRASKVTGDLKLGDSIAVNGACLTA